MKKLLSALFTLFLFLGFAQITHAATPQLVSLIPQMTFNASSSGKVTYSAAIGGLEKGIQHLMANRIIV
ncbi:UNVERIFIED_CONTAM: hypothetical protein ABIC26_002550 [Paenibacillus sp. PvR008]